MKFISIWTPRPETRKAAIENFLAGKAAALPAGVATVGRWHKADGSGGFTLSESAAAEAMYEEFKEPLYTPPALLLRMVEAGQLGRKSGRGFYEYATA